MATQRLRKAADNGGTGPKGYQSTTLDSCADPRAWTLYLWGQPPWCNWGAAASFYTVGAYLLPVTMGSSEDPLWQSLI